VKDKQHTLFQQSLRVSSSLLALSVWCAASAAKADEANDSVTTFEEVVVTGTPLNKTHEVNVGAFGNKNLMDIPLAIQSYSAEDIANNAARTILDALEKDPSVQSASVGGGYDVLRLRGFSMDWTNTLRRDGLSLAPYQDVPQENIERIDVLKGPSGFLYGFNSPGGTVNYMLKRPTLEPFMRVTGELGLDSGRYVAVDISNSVSDGRIGYRINAAHEKDGDFTGAGDFERSFAGIATDWRISDTAVFQVNFDYQSKESEATPLLRADQSGRADSLDPSTYVLPPRVDRDDLLSPSWYRYTTEAYNIDARLDIELNNDWFIVVQANHSNNTRDAAFVDLFDIQSNGDIGFGGLFFYENENFKVSSAQSYVSGYFETGGIEHNIFVGASYKKYKNPQPVFLDPVVSVGNVLNPVDPAEIAFALPTLDRINRITEGSIYASDLITITEQWQLLLGGRYIWYDGSSETPAGVETPEQRERKFVPNIGLVFKPADNITTYASYSKGLEQGLFAPFFANNAGTQTAPIESKQYELGVKVNVTEKLNFSLAAFQAEKQAGFVDLALDFVVDGKQRHKGIEFVANGQINDNFSMSASFAYLDTELRDVIEVETLGKRTQGAPKWQGHLSLEHTVPAINGLVANVSLNYASSRAVDAQNSGFIDGYEIVDASLRYDTNIYGQDVLFRFIGKNLFNKYYFNSADFLGGLGLGEKREFILSATVTF